MKPLIYIYIYITYVLIVTIHLIRINYKNNTKYKNYILKDKQYINKFIVIIKSNFSITN